MRIGMAPTARSMLLAPVASLPYGTLLSAEEQAGPARGVLSAAAAPVAPQPVLDLRLTETPKPAYGQPLPAKIQGRVVLDDKGDGQVDPTEKGVPNVSVSDGYTVARTGPDGTYCLTPSKFAVFVSITRPTGYDVAGAWYKPVGARIDFALKPAARDENEYIFVHVTDAHISSNRRSIEGLSRFVREVNALTPRPRFVVNSGDLVNLDKALSTPPRTGHAWFRNYVGIMNHLAMPYYNVAGDHTDSSYRLKEFPRGDIRCGKPMYWEYLGPHFFSFEYGRIHFVSADYAYHLGRRQIRGREYPTLQVQPMHVEWLKQDMANRTTGSFVVTTSEHDLTKHCPGFSEMARQYDVRLQLTGDDHIVAHRARFVPYRTGGALSGTWWDGPCADLSPQGYLIYQVHGTEMTCFYKGLGQRVAFVSPAHGVKVKGLLTLRAHLVQPRDGEVLLFSVNGGDWKPMKEVHRPFCRTLYEATWDSAVCPDGLVEVKAKSSADGETQHRVLVVHNGTAVTKFQTDASLTFLVGRVIAAGKAPRGNVDVLVNGESVGMIHPQRKREYAFAIPACVLRTVNTLEFRFAESHDGMTITHPLLTHSGRTFEDPYAAATRAVRRGHWPEDIVNRAGFIVGEGIDEGAFALKRSAFHFVLPPEAGS